MVFTLFILLVGLTEIEAIERGTDRSLVAVNVKSSLNLNTSQSNLRYFFFLPNKLLVLNKLLLLNKKNANYTLTPPSMFFP